MRDGDSEIERSEEDVSAHGVLLRRASMSAIIKQYCTLYGVVAE